MLNKLQVTMLVGLVLGVVRTFFPGIDVPEAFEAALEALVNSLFVIVPVLMGWFVRESQRKVDKLKTKFPVLVVAMLGAALAISPSSVHAQDVEVGGSFMLNDEEALDVSDFRGFAAVSGIELPVPGDTYTGAMFEVGYSNAVLWSLWSINRTEIRRVIAGGDVRIAKGGPAGGSSFDVAARIVSGYRLTDNLAFLAYFLEDNTPFQFAVSWRFDFPGLGDGE